MANARGTLGALVVGLVIGGAGTFGYFSLRAPGSPFREGQILMQKSKFSEAADAFTEALKLEPDHSDARIALATSLQSQGKSDEALDAYRAAENSMKESLAQFYGNLAALYQQKNDAKSAQDAYTKQALFRAQPLDSYYETAMTYAAHGQGGDALKEFDKVLQINPKHAAAAFQAGRVAEQSGKIKEAVRYYETALRADPNLKAAKDRLAALKKGGKSSVTKKVTSQSAPKPNRLPASKRVRH